MPTKALQPVRRGRPAPSPNLARNVTVLSITAAFATTWYLAWSPVVPLLLAGQGAPGPAVAITFALVNLGLAVPQYLGGRLADRVGVRTVIGWTGVALGATWLVMAATAASWLALAACYVAGNALFGLQSTAFVTIVADSVQEAERTRAFGSYQLWSAVALVVGPLLGALVLLPRVTAPRYLALTGVAYLAVGVARLVLLREPGRPPQHPERPKPPPAGVLEVAAGDRSRRRLLALTIGVTLAFAFTIYGPFMPVATHLLDRLPTRLVDLLFGIGPLGAVAASHLAPRLGGERRALSVALTALALAAGAIAFPLPRPLLVAAYLMVFAAYQVATVAFSAERVRLAGTVSAGEVLGASAAAAGLVACAALAAVGPLGDRLPLLLATGLCLLTAVVPQAWYRADANAARREAAAALDKSGMPVS